MVTNPTGLVCADMTETPDAPKEDVEPGVRGHEEPDARPAGSRSAVPMNPVPAAALVDEQADEEQLDADIAAAQEDEPGPEPPGPTAAQLAARVAELTLAVEATQRRADELLMVARRQTEMADELHKENRRLRDGEIREAVAPLVRGLARLADDVARIRGIAEHDSDDLAYIDGQVQELLHDAGVFVTGAQPGEPFDPQIHQATGSAPTDDMHLHRTIAEVRRTGLRRDDGRMLRAVDVVVHRYVITPEPLVQPEAPAETGDEQPPEAPIEQIPPDEEGS